MIDQMIPWLIIAITSLIFSALFSGSEIAFISSDRVRTELDMKKGGLLGRIIRKFYSDSDFFISSILVGNNVMLVIYGMAAAKLLTPTLEQITTSPGLLLLLQTIVSTLIILLVGEFLPKAIFRINPNSSLKIVAFPIYVFYLLLYPVSWFTTWISRVLMRMLGLKEQTERVSMLSVGDLNDYLEETIDRLDEKKTEVEHEVKIFQNALDFSSTHIRDCMIPRNEIVAVNIDSASRSDLVHLFTESGRSKIIVYKDDIDTIVGYIHVSELFDPEADWHKQLKPVVYAPETLLANKLMRRLLAEKRSIAIVVDEFGGTAGIVTLEDLVEEIFGDIRDEHDSASQMSRQIADGIYEFAGRCEIEAINDTYHLDIEESEDYQTIAGYILHSTGTIPEQGTILSLGGLQFDIVKKSANRLELIRVTLPSNAGDKDATA